MSALSGALKKRGHHVTFVNFEHVRDVITPRGFDFLSLDPSAATALPSIKMAYAELSRLTGRAGVRHTVRIFSESIARLCRHGPDLIRAAGIDMLLIDQYEMGGACVAERLGLPFVTVCNGLPFNWEPMMPPVTVDWAYSTSWAGRVRALAGRQITRWIGAPILNTINGFRTQWGLPLWRTLDQSCSALAQLAQGTAAFDFPRRRLPPSFHYLGLFNDAADHAMEFPWDRLNKRPLIYASLGTLLTGQDRFYRTIAAACATEAVQLVLSLGGRAVDSIGPLAGNPLVTRYAPQFELLARAALTITHGGFNTVLHSLWHGVPMVVIPMTNDQPGSAARVRHHAVGESIRPKEVTVGALRAAVRRVLKNRVCQERALLQSRALQNAGGADGAADLIERALKGGVHGA